LTWQDVVMARHPEVFVRDLSMAEGQKLQRITRTAKDPVKLRRAIVVFMSGQGQSVGDIVHLLRVDDGYVRDVIHAFNERGFSALDPKWSGGRPAATDEMTRQKVIAMARTDPRALGLPFAGWSLAKLAAHLAREKITTVGREAIRRILRAARVTFQTTTTWKASTDPDFVAKMTRVLHLYDHRPADGRVICYDEFGPLNLMPRKGKAWRPAGTPRRLRATHTRTQGVRHMPAALDLATGQMLYRIRARKRWAQFLDLLKVLRRRYPDERLYVILDNYSPHKRAEVSGWCQANNVELVFIPTNASWLNWIEAEFAALRYFALNGTDHRSHDEQGQAIAGYIRWRNAEARPKRDFAIKSKIRSPDWQANYRAKVSC
jgi:transposase